MYSTTLWFLWDLIKKRWPGGAMTNDLTVNYVLTNYCTNEPIIIYKPCNLTMKCGKTATVFHSDNILTDNFFF